MKIKYTGVPSFRIGAKLIKTGDEVEVDEITAATLCESSSWEAATKKKSQKAKKDD